MNLEWLLRNRVTLHQETIKSQERCEEVLQHIKAIIPSLSSWFLTYVLLNFRSNTGQMTAKKSKRAEIKTKPNSSSVVEFITSIKEEQKRKDSFAILEMMKKATGEEPKMWGSSMIGFGNKIYKSPTSGREVEWLIIGFSPRKANLSLYLSLNIKQHADALKKLGKHKTGVGCLYINKLEDVDVKVLKDIINSSLDSKRD